MLQLKENNLYSNGVVSGFPNGDILLTRERLVYTGLVTDKYHTIIQGESLTSIAYRYYKPINGDASKYWWVIADVNDIYNPIDIEDLIGSEIIIPDLVMIKLTE